MIKTNNTYKLYFITITSKNCYFIVRLLCFQIVTKIHVQRPRRQNWTFVRLQYYNGTVLPFLSTFITMVEFFNSIVLNQQAWNTLNSSICFADDKNSFHWWTCFKSWRENIYVLHFLENKLKGERWNISEVCTYIWQAK